MDTHLKLYKRKGVLGKYMKYVVKDIYKIENKEERERKIISIIIEQLKKSQEK